MSAKFLILKCLNMDIFTISINGIEMIFPIDLYKMDYSNLYGRKKGKQKLFLSDVLVAESRSTIWKILCVSYINLKL